MHTSFLHPRKCNPRHAPQAKFWACLVSRGCGCLVCGVAVAWCLSRNLGGLRLAALPHKIWAASSHTYNICGLWLAGLRCFNKLAQTPASAVESRAGRGAQGAACAPGADPRNAYLAQSTAMHLFKKGIPGWRPIWCFLFWEVGCSRAV